MLVAAGFTPSSPLLLPSVNKQHREDVQASWNALESLADDWYARGIETVVLISESRFAYANALSADIADPYIMNLEELGDLSPKATYHPDFGLIDTLQRYCRKHSAPLTLSTESGLPYGCAAPLAALASRIPTLRILPIITAPGCDAKEHFLFGELLRHVMSESPKRIGVIASGDISLTHVADMQKILEEKSRASLLTLAPSLDGAQKEDAAYRPLAVLFGVLEGMSVRAEILSTESPFEAGYVVAEFSL